MIKRRFEVCGVMETLGFIEALTNHEKSFIMTLMKGDRMMFNTNVVLEAHTAIRMFCTLSLLLNYLPKMYLAIFYHMACTYSKRH